MRADPVSAKHTFKLSIFLSLSGSAHVKADRRTLVKLTLDHSKLVFKLQSCVH